LIVADQNSLFYGAVELSDKDIIVSGLVGLYRNGGDSSNFLKLLNSDTHRLYALQAARTIAEQVQQLPHYPPKGALRTDIAGVIRGLIRVSDSLACLISGPVQSSRLARSSGTAHCRPIIRLCRHGQLPDLPHSPWVTDVFTESARARFGESSGVRSIAKSDLRPDCSQGVRDRSVSLASSPLIPDAPFSSTQVGSNCMTFKP
jgi:hypothetical protein